MKMELRRLGKMTHTEGAADPGEVNSTEGTGEEGTIKVELLSGSG